MKHKLISGAAYDIAGFEKLMNLAEEELSDKKILDKNFFAGGSNVFCVIEYTDKIVESKKNAKK